MAESLTLRVQGCLNRLQAGERGARDDLIRCAGERLQHLARKMLRAYPGVRRWEETGDVFQNAMLRLCRALNDVAPATPLDFFRLAALQIRRELVDLARHHYGPEGPGAHHASHRQHPQNSGTNQTHEPAADHTDADQLASWTEFHEQVEALPDEERVVFDLLWYQGLEQADVAELLGASVRTIKRRWQAARLKLHEALEGEMPEV